MVMLNVNHGVKGSVAWAWPPAQEIQDVSTKLAKALTDPAVTSLVLGAKMVKVKDCGMDEGVVDVSAWVPEDGAGTMLVAWVNPGRAVLDVTSIDLAPALQGGMSVTGVKSVVWGQREWAVSQSRSSLVQTGGAAGLGPLEVNMLILDVSVVPAAGPAAVQGGSVETS